jgi:hypothetical protein
MLFLGNYVKEVLAGAINHPTRSSTIGAASILL